MDALGGESPSRAVSTRTRCAIPSANLPNTLSRMYRWLHLLDMAITPAMLRQALTPDTDSEVAEALLRYFVRRREPSDVNRDKTDLIATFLYRHPRVPGQWEQSGYGLDGALPLSPFEIALIEILADTDVPSLPEEHVQLLRRFDPLREEVARFRDFNALIDSGMIGPRARIEAVAGCVVLSSRRAGHGFGLQRGVRQEVRRIVRQGARPRSRLSARRWKKWAERF